MGHLIKITLKTTKSNISITEGKIGKWLFSWSNNQVEAFAEAEYNAGSISDPFDLVRKTTKLNLALLIDCLTMIVNQEVNTSIVISTDPKILVYQKTNSKRVTSIHEARTLTRSIRPICNASSLGEEVPKRIDEGVTINLSEDRIRILRYLLDFFSKKKSYKNIHLKLVNYWRKGVDLDQLMLVDESYLAFFKIIEYYINRSNVKESDIPSKFREPKSLQDAYKFSLGTGLSSMKDDQLQMISDFVHIRNNWDIAHVKMGSLPDDKFGGLYYSHMDEGWEYHSHICQISRWVILKELGIKDLMLENNGGLLELSITE
ncbi:MAG: hypothetical protein ABI425_02370 [Patescibacteria group bacterium]